MEAPAAGAMWHLRHRRRSLSAFIPGDRHRRSVGALSRYPDRRAESSTGAVPTTATLCAARQKQLSNIAFRVQVRHSVTDAAYRACNCSTTPPPRPPDRPPARRRESGLGRAESVIVEFPRSVLGIALACCGTSFHESARSSTISERDTVIVFRECRNTARIARNSVPHERPFSGTTCAIDRGEGEMCTAPRARTAGHRTDATAGPAGTDAPRGRSKSMKSDAVTAMSPPPPTGLPLRRRHTTSPGAEPWA
ncbi:hypothetical protein Rruber_00381 [Rhodococcus ruber]